MELKEFLNSLDGALRLYIEYSLKKLGLSLERLEEEEVMEVLAEAVGPHVAEVLYSMYLSANTQKREVLVLAT